MRDDGQLSLDRALSRLREKARPSVYALRRIRARVRNLLRPTRAWDGHHHPVLDRFPPWHGHSDGRYHHDFLGVRTDPRFKPYFRPDPPGPIHPDYPTPGPGYFELVFVLDSVVRACETHSNPFTMLELGAGYGPWLVTAHHAVQRMDPRPVRLVGVEMNPLHVSYLRDHLRTNGVDASACEVHQAAVSDIDGVAVFLVDPDPGLAYGQRIRRRFADATPPRGDRASPSLADVERVPCLSLQTLLRGRGVIDLVHMDVQGEEWRILRSARSSVRQCVSRLLVTTHSRRIHRRVRGLFRGSEWDCSWDFRCRKREPTPFGHVQFHDGLLAFVNRTARSPLA